MSVVTATILSEGRQMDPAYELKTVKSLFTVWPLSIKT